MVVRSVVALTGFILMAGCDSGSQSSQDNPNKPEVSRTDGDRGPVSGAPYESSDERLAASRGITVDEMADPNRHYGYTEPDQEFLQEHGVSEAEARAAERVLCGQGVDC